MRKLRLLTVVFLILNTGLINVGCINCINVNCGSEPNFWFNYLSPDNEDLLNGPTKNYELEDVKIYSLDSNSNKNFVSLSSYENDPFQIMATIMSATPTVFLEIKGVVKDTLDFKFYLESGCCAQTKITETNINGTHYTGDFPIKFIE